MLLFVFFCLKTLILLLLLLLLFLWQRLDSKMCACFLFRARGNEGMKSSRTAFQRQCFLTPGLCCLLFFPDPQVLCVWQVGHPANSQRCCMGYLNSELIPRQWLAGQMTRAVLLACRTPAKMLRGKSNERGTLERMGLQQSREASGSQIWVLTPCKLKLRAWGRPQDGDSP